jgi:hypothetical protein
MSRPFADDAPRYFEARANVLPIASGAKVPPCGVRWTDWQRRKQTDEEFSQLLDAYSAEDVALVLGRGSGGLLDIETDGQEGEQALRELRLPLPPTAMFESRRGAHRLYRTACPLRSCKGLRPKLDVLAAGSYAVVPSSQPRAWLTPGVLDDVTALPEAWEEFLSRHTPRLTGPALHAVERDGVGDLRNVHLASLVGRWITQGSADAEIHARAREWARKVPVVPPFTEDEAERVADSILRTRRRTRSPEREAVILARAFDLRQPLQAVFVALVALWGELGLTEPVVAAPHRLVASYARVDRDVVGPALRGLEDAGLVVVGEGRDPWGRRVTVVRFRVALGAGDR